MIMAHLLIIHEWLVLICAVCCGLQTSMLSGIIKVRWVVLYRHLLTNLHFALDTEHDNIKYAVSSSGFVSLTFSPVYTF